MLVRYDCPNCGKNQLHLIRGQEAPAEMRCPECGALAMRMVPRVKSQYKSEGFTKRVEREEET